MRAVVIGAGAIGGSLAAFAAAADRDVTLVDVDERHVDAIRESGLTITGAADLTAAVDVRLPGDVNGPFDVAILSVTLADLHDATSYAMSILSGSAPVVTLQNGLAAEAVAAAIGVDRVLPGSVSFAGRLKGPGRIGLASRGPVHIGEFKGSATARVHDVVELLAPFGPIVADDNVWGFVWAKLALAAVMTALAIDGRPNLEIYQDEAQWPSLSAVLGTVARCATASGVTLEQVKGIEVAPFIDWPDLSAEIAARTWTKLAADAWAGRLDKPYSGIRAAIDAGRPTEAHRMLEPVIAKADEHDVDATVLRAMLAMISKLEQGICAGNPALLRATIPGMPPT
jgi:2-dehydropantoate 2-reductase